MGRVKKPKRRRGTETEERKGTEGEEATGI